MNINNKYSPYWILNPLRNNITIKTYGEWSFFLPKEVIEGQSPLSKLGEGFFRKAHNMVSLYDHNLWIFSNKEFDYNDCYRFSRILKAVSETFCNSYLSQPGVIIMLSNGDIEEQPSTPSNKSTSGSENLTDEKLIRVLDVTERIYELNLVDYLDVFEYLSEIKKSSLFISELALWSFVEQHWKGDKKSNNELAESLKRLGTTVYNRKDPDYVEFKNNLRTFIDTTGGKKKNLSDMRNLLAHGTFFKQKNNWDNRQWSLFVEIHEFLFNMVLLGLEQEINNF
ncbi:hypothetical protein CSC81_12670 [Tenacibaculum discolor]|uniref:Apea-like HEPN domain-containing protein n=1 Tax=Tenacibaculum discolor TaxID=361581 RepID=A0A2G1BRZ1_9FLAO|nr:hypothetical protein [Tenacibaculum discolor]MDP2541883.1 hypothetical protein [Tenacibaculum discolor]PHN96806.1 hypothetical protein CSC81_12670 [Tenacibaculum discolor]